MEHTEEYLQSKHVIANPKEYCIEDVQRANSFVRAYEQGIKAVSALLLEESAKKMALEYCHEYSPAEYQGFISACVVIAEKISKQNL
tara:strand:- start:231 stop:491 length:261 start_codon:yes stop_codon:yes gene_type:complete